MAATIWTHGLAEQCLYAIPIDGTHRLGGCLVRRVSRWEWGIDGEPPRRLLTAIDRLMGPATPEAIPAPE